MINSDKEQILKGFIPIQTVLDNFLKPIYRRYRFEVHQLATNWDKIIGYKLASISTPSSIYFQNHYKNCKQKINGTLVVSITNPGFALALQAAEGAIVSQVTNYFGYKIISKIRIRICNDTTINMTRSINSTISTYTTLQRGYINPPMVNKNIINKQQWQELEAALIKINDIEVGSSLKALRDALFELQ